MIHKGSTYVFTTKFPNNDRACTRLSKLVMGPHIEELVDTFGPTAGDKRWVLDKLSALRDVRALSLTVAAWVTTNLRMSLCQNGQLSVEFDVDKVHGLNDPRDKKDEKERARSKKQAAKRTSAEKTALEKIVNERLE